MKRRKFLKKSVISLSGLVLAPEILAKNWNANLNYDEDILNIEKIFGNKLCFRRTNQTEENPLGLNIFYYDNKIKKQLKEDPYFIPKENFVPKQVRKCETLTSVNEIEVRTANSKNKREPCNRIHVWGWKPLSNQDIYSIMNKNYYLFEKEVKQNQMGFYMVPKKGTTKRNNPENKSTIITSKEGIYLPIF